MNEWINTEAIKFNQIMKIQLLKALKIGNFLHKFPVVFHNYEVLESRKKF